MRRMFIFAILITVLVSPALGLEYKGQKIKPFAAEQYSIDKKGQETLVGNIYIGDKGVRSETMVNPENGQQMITIYIVDENVQYFINPQTKKYYQTNIKPEELEKWFGDDITVDEKNTLKTEKIQGYKCKIKKVSTTVKVLGFSKTVKSTQYFSEKLGVAIRTVNDDGSAIEYRNIKEGKQDPSLFKLPEGLTKTSNMMGVFMGTAEEEPTEGQEQEKENAMPDASDVLKGIFG